jgi:hypothetical protein
MSHGKRYRVIALSASIVAWLLLPCPAPCGDITWEEWQEQVKDQEGPMWDQIRDILERTQGEGCICPNPLSDEPEVGVIWRGEAPIGLDQIATLAAPTLWFSLDEPLLTSAQGPLPNRHPCDGQRAERGVVYYAVSLLRRHEGMEPVTMPVGDDPDFMVKVHSFILRYYFYYLRDYGVGEHAHDLEVAEFHLRNERTARDCYQVRLTKVIGLAHGVDWYNNISEVRYDTRLPISLLVEEGKHASCPDRNGDGIYTPGYDVTKRPNDAWGVRDVLGQGILQGSAYKASMSKTRDRLTRMLPPEDAERCPSLPSRAAATGEFLNRYELRRASEIDLCEAEQDPERLASMMKKHGFGSGKEPDQYEGNSIEELTSKIESPASIIPAVSLRWDDSIGFSFLLRGFDLTEFWLVPKFNLADRATGLGVLTTPSASRWADWYFTVGVDRFREETETRDGEKVTVQEVEWQPAVELGYKFRFLAPSKIRPLLLGYQFGGFRVGTRFNGFDTLKTARIVVELGAGVW